MPTHRKFPVPEDERERWCCECIANHWCAVLQVTEGEASEPAFQYSVGLTHSFEHPELCFFHPNAALGHAVINDFRDRIRSGERFTDGQRASGALEGFDVVLRTAHTSHYREHFGFDRWLYGGDNFEMLQIVWPDKSGRFPGEPECHPHVLKVQPMLWIPAQEPT